MFTSSETGETEISIQERASETEVKVQYQSHRADFHPFIPKWYCDTDFARLLSRTNLFRFPDYQVAGESDFLWLTAFTCYGIQIW